MERAKTAVLHDVPEVQIRLRPHEIVGGHDGRAVGCAPVREERARGSFPVRGWAGRRRAPDEYCRNSYQRTRGKPSHDLESTGPCRAIRTLWTGSILAGDIAQRLEEVAALPRRDTRQQAFLGLSSQHICLFE
ncbi:Uncharacterised protein [Mycobacteroides abscessus subsp. massiliense]|nr:Uncharacterised protein [Mycobacteroides abscessus subsp. massiliense]